MSLWLLFGASLGLPVDELVEAINFQLVASKRQLRGHRLRLSVSERLRLASFSQRLSTTFNSIFRWIVSPESMIRWLKRYQERRANSSSTNRPGRPWINQNKVGAILRIYDSGLTGLKRIVGELEKCGIHIAKSTVRNVLTRNGRTPTDHNRRTGSTWAQFWARHAPDLVGVDFLQIPIGLFGKIVNAFVLFAIEHDTRRVYLLGITTHPTDAWVANCVRSVTMDGAALAVRKYWILDHDSKYGPKTKAALEKKIVWTSLRAPDMNAFAERWALSIQTECLNHMVFLSEEMLRRYVTEYVAHHNTERPHQGIGNRPVGEWSVGDGKIVCDRRLNGLLTSFRRAA